jgi:MFS family permease
MGVRRVYTITLFIVMASIDNMVLALAPVLIPSIGADLQISNQALGLTVSLNLVVVAIAGLFWGYRSDQSDRRSLLILGTLAWAAPIGLIPWSNSYLTFLGLMGLAGLGLGCVSTVGYTVITDIVVQRWRGALLGLWGLAQGIGTLGGGVLAGVLVERYDWRVPFGAMAIVGVVCSGLALLTLSPRKGAADEALRPLIEQGGDYTYRIQRADLPCIFARPSNRWIMLQGLLAQFTYGSLTWITALLTAKLVAEEIELSLANGIAALFVVLLQVGGIVSVFWGWIGDRLQQRSPQARALIAAYGFWVALPCYLLLFWAPLPVSGMVEGTALQIIVQQLRHNVWWWLTILAATLAVAAQATNAPNWYALVSEVNLPEHRGTAFSFIMLANNIGRALGAFFVGVTFDWLQHAAIAPTNYALGLSLFQLFFIPAGLCFWLAARTTPQDAAAVQNMLHSRAANM